MRFKVIAILLVSLVRPGLTKAQLSNSITASPSTSGGELIKDGTPGRSAASVRHQWRCEDLDFCNDKLGFEAIKSLHFKLDNDKNGDVDMNESVGFFRHGLKHDDANERQRQFHGNDKHISLDELWRHWLKSDAHNWTVEQTIDWLVNCVQLEEYVDLFRRLQLNGSSLPRYNRRFFKDFKEYQLMWNFVLGILQTGGRTGKLLDGRFRNQRSDSSTKVDVKGNGRGAVWSSQLDIELCERFFVGH